MDLPWQVFGKQSGYQRRRHPYESQEPCSNKIRPWTLLLDPYCLNTSNFHKTVNRKPRSRQRIRIASIAKKQERRKELRPEEEKIALFLLFCLGDVKRTEAIKGCLCPLWVCRERRKYLWERGDGCGRGKFERVDSDDGVFVWVSGGFRPSILNVIYYGHCFLYCVSSLLFIVHIGNHLVFSSIIRREYLKKSSNYGYVWMRRKRFVDIFSWKWFYMGNNLKYILKVIFITKKYV
jgi:hypothetical protein